MDGLDAKPKNVQREVVGSKQPANFVDSMDASNYILLSLPKPMGIVFEENDDTIGGIFAFELSEGSIAATEGTVQPGDNWWLLVTKRLLEKLLMKLWEPLLIVQRKILNWYSFEDRPSIFTDRQGRVRNGWMNSSLRFESARKCLKISNLEEIIDARN